MRFADYLEKKRHGSIDFPIEYYYVAPSHAQYVMPAHWHAEFEIIKVLEGSIDVFLNNVKYTLGKNDILLVECGLLHRGEPKDCIYECVVFDVGMLTRRQNDASKKFIEPLMNSTYSISHPIQQSDSHIGTIVTALIDTLKQGSQYYDLNIYSHLFSLFATLYKDGCIVSKAPQNHPSRNISKLIDWIQVNFTEVITLDMLAKIAHLKKNYLCRIFKEYTSKTITEYINELRIENACYEISKNGKSITEAAYDSGFNNLSYFCKTFKKLKNLTPKEYKKQNYEINSKYTQH